MARPQRVEYKGAYYHVTSAGRGRQVVFAGSEYHEAFESCLAQAHKRFGLEVHAYCLLSNHYHLLVRTPRGNLSRAMRHINGVYTQFYNRRKGTDGTLFKGRYKAINIESSSYLLEVSRYIHRSPIEIKKPLVTHLEDYKWSSYQSYRNKRETAEWLYKEAIFGKLGSGQPTAAYRRYVEMGLDEETQKFYNKNQWPAVRGSKKFIEKAVLHAAKDGKVIAIDRSLLEFEAVVLAVSTRMKTSTEGILEGRRGKGNKNLSRWLAMKLSQEYTGMRLEELASKFGVTYSAVSATIGRLNREIEADKKTAALYKVLCKDLSSLQK